MYENSLKTIFQKIFEVKKVSYDEPDGYAMEQDVLFIEIESSRNRIKSGKATAYVEGRAFIYGQNNKIPFGFFSKKLHEAEAKYTKSLFLNNFEENKKSYQNLVERSFSFVYFFSGQYDPDTGNITDIVLDINSDLEIEF